MGSLPARVAVHQLFVRFDLISQGTLALGQLCKILLVLVPFRIQFGKENHADLAILDIDIPDMNGLALAAKIKQFHPDMAIIFLTGFSQYAVEAFEMHASGYILKPVKRERLSAEVAHALSGKRKAPEAHIVARTFGNFDVFVDGELVTFKVTKCKELLAYLIDRQGSSATRSEVFSIL